MQAPLPENEAQRLETLRRYQILDTPPEQQLDDITLLAAHLCEAPIALITLVDAGRQWFKSKLGWAEPGTSRDISFCAHAILEPDKELIVEDASRDTRFSGNPLVTSDPLHFRFYAGVPLVTPDGHALGTLCVLDRVPRTLAPAQLGALRALARCVIVELELRLNRRELQRSEEAAAELARNLDRRVAQRTSALSESEERYRRLVDSSPDAILIHSEGRIVFVNQAMVALIRAGNAAALVGKPSTFMVAPEYLESARRRTSGLYSGEARPRAEQVYIRLDGSPVDVEVASAPLVLDHKPAVQVTVRDITERKRIEEKLRKSESRSSAILHSALDCIIIMDHEESIVEFNPAAQATFGITREQAIGRRMPDLIIPARLRDAHLRGFAQCLSTGTGPILGKRTEMAAMRADGTEFPVELTVIVIGAPPHLLFVGSIRDITVRRQRDADLRQFRAAMEISRDAIFLIDRASLRYIDVNQTFCDMVGYSRQELIGMTPTQEFSADQATLERDYDAVIADANSPASRREGWFRSKNGALIPIESHRGAMQSDNGWVIVGNARDISERKNSEAKIRRLNRVYAVLSGINAAIVRIRDRDELFREACRIAVDAGEFRLAWLGVYDQTAQRVNLIARHGPASDYTALMPPDLWDTGPAGRGMAKSAVLERKAQICNDMSRDPRILTKQEALQRDLHSVIMLPLLVAGEPTGVLTLYAGEAEFFVADEIKLLHELAGDIAFALDHIEKAERLNYLAYYDEITGLPNRTLFLERTSQRLRRHAGDKRMMALALLDIDRFRIVNDTLGREAGDELLKMVAQRMQLSEFGHDSVARVGVNCFGIALRDPREAESVVLRLEQILHSCFAKPFRLRGSDLRFAGRVGIALYPFDGEDAETLFRNAEAALKRAKRSAELILFYAPEMNARVAEMLNLESKLRTALDLNQFVLHYQPKVSLASDKITGAEALIRWNDPQSGLVAPNHFIPILETTGLIYEVGRWALRQALKDNLRWRAAGLTPIRIAVNVSPLQLRHRGFVAEIRNIIATDPQAAACLELEITESMVMEDIGHNFANLQAIRAMGMSIAIDDFGTGHSSLGHLAKLPADTLKIDRLFVLDMMKGPRGLALMSTIINLAHALELKVVAEGVETAEQSRLLRLISCDEIQGYVLSKPLPAEEFERQYLSAPPPQ